jgi:hypothetical protein
LRLVKKSDESMVEVLALLNSGYRKGQCAIRVEKVEQGSLQIAMFDTFGFKVLAGTEELAATLQSRCIITSMSKAVKQVRLFVDEELVSDQQLLSETQDLVERALRFYGPRMVEEEEAFRRREKLWEQETEGSQ